jgi:Crinkler effector protein N-terminal domain
MSYVAIGPSSSLQLFCYVHDDDYKHAFEVKLGMDDSVAALKNVIKKEKSPLFNHIPADSLVLWNENIPLDEHLKEAVDKLGLVNEKSLSPATRMSKIFPRQPEDGQIHIVVKGEC